MGALLQEVTLLRSCVDAVGLLSAQSLLHMQHYSYASHAFPDSSNAGIVPTWAFEPSTEAQGAAGGKATASSGKVADPSKVTDSSEKLPIL